MVRYTCSNFWCVTNFANTITIAVSVNNVHDISKCFAQRIFYTRKWCVQMSEYSHENRRFACYLLRFSTRHYLLASDFEKIRYSSFRASIFSLYLFKFALPFLTLCTCNRFVIRYIDLRKIYNLHVYMSVVLCYSSKVRCNFYKKLNREEA